MAGGRLPARRAGTLAGRRRPSPPAGAWGVGEPGSPLPEVASRRLRRGRRTRPDHHDAAQRGRRGFARPRLPLHRPARHRQDQYRAHPRQGRELRGPPRRRAGQRLHLLPRVQRGPRARPDRARRGLQPRDRRGARAARERRLRPQRGQLQGLPRGRGPHAHRRGLQRPAQDPRGAARPRHLRPRHHRAAPHPADDQLALPAFRLPARLAARARRAHRRDRRRRGASASPRAGRS